MTPYQEFMAADFQRVLEAEWSQEFDKDQALSYIRVMSGAQSEYSDDLVYQTEAWKARFGDEKADGTVKPKATIKAEGMAAPIPRDK